MNTKAGLISIMPGDTTTKGNDQRHCRCPGTRMWDIHDEKRMKRSEGQALGSF